MRINLWRVIIIQAWFGFGYGFSWGYAPLPYSWSVSTVAAWIDVPFVLGAAIGCWAEQTLHSKASNPGQKSN